jgi:hypothetical protein
LETRKMKTSILSRDLEIKLWYIMCWEGSQLVFRFRPSFLLLVMIHDNKVSNIVWLWCIACFIDKKLVQQHKFALVKKMTSIGVEVIDIRKFSLGHILTRFCSMSFCPRKTQSSLGYLDSFCIIHKWNGIRRVSILKHPSKNLWIVRPLS